MSDTNQDESLTERVDVTAQPDGAFIGRLEIGVMSQPICEANQLEELNALRSEVLTFACAWPNSKRRLPYSPSQGLGSPVR